MGLGNASFCAFRVELAPWPSLDLLTSAEREVAVALTRGWSSASLARHRGVSCATIANQIASLFDKLGVHSRTELAARLANVMLGSAVTSAMPGRRKTTRAIEGHVLVVEDTPRTREEVQTALQDVGYRVTAVEDLAGARRLLSERSPDVVLCDVRLGNESGIDLLAKGESPACPVVFMSGAAELDEAIVGLALGAWDFVDKSWGMGRIRVAVGEALAGPRSRRPVPAAAVDAEAIDAPSATSALIGGGARFVGAIERDRGRHILFERCSIDALTSRERFAIGRALHLAPTKAIGIELGVSEVTAWTILHDTMERLGFAQRIEAMACLAPLAPHWSEELPGASTLAG